MIELVASLRRNLWKRISVMLIVFVTAVECNFHPSMREDSNEELQTFSPIASVFCEVFALKWENRGRVMIKFKTIAQYSRQTFTSIQIQNMVSHNKLITVK